MKKAAIMAALVVAAAIMLSAGASAQEYYADVVLDVSASGSVSISGATNHPDLAPQTTQALTSKNGSIWEISISMPGKFSEYVYEMRLPTGAEIIDINTAGQYRLSSSEGRIVTIGTGQNTPFFAEVKYEMGESAPIEQTPTMPVLLVLAAVAIIVAYLKLSEKKKNPKKAESAKKGYDKEALTERQLQIVGFLEKKGGKATQAELQEHTSLPKASLSRNLDALARKGITKKERKGMTMLVSLEK